MADIAVQKPALLAAAPTSTAASGGGDTLTSFSADSPLYLRFTVGANSTTVTIDDPNTQSPEQAAAFNPDVQFTFISASRIVKIAKPARFVNASTGKIALTYSQVTGLTVEAWQ